MTFPMQDQQDARNHESDYLSDAQIQTELKSYESRMGEGYSFFAFFYGFSALVHSSIIQHTSTVEKT